jgi:hypothetical protein
MTSELHNLDSTKDTQTKSECLLHDALIIWRGYDANRSNSINYGRRLDC